MLKNKKENQLLYAGAGIFFCTCVIYAILSVYHLDLLPVPNRFGDFSRIISILFAALIAAPIFEEFVFRSVFLKRKLFTFFFYTGSVAFIIILKNYYLLILLSVIFLLEYQIKNKNLNIFFVLNSILFALLHYKISDFHSIFSVIPVFFQFSIGLILIWITLNYGLKWSIITHFFINASILVPVFLVLQFPTDTKSYTLESNGNRFKWEKTSIMGTFKISYSDRKVIAERATIEQFIDLFSNGNLKLKVTDSLSLFRYHFKLENQNKKPFKADEVEHILIKSGLAEPDK